VLDALDASAEAVNEGIALLTDEPPSEAAYKRVAAAAPQLRGALQLFSRVRCSFRA
jgi:hypothetical protein